MYDFYRFLVFIKKCGNNMTQTFKVAFNKAINLISKKRDILLINQINNALNVIHETEYYNILDYLKDKGVNLSSITDIPVNNENDKVKVYYVKGGATISEHTHEFIESYICLFGNIKINLCNDYHIINSFETFKIDKNQKHSIEFIEDTFLIVFAQ